MTHYEVTVYCDKGHTYCSTCNNKCPTCGSVHLKSKNSVVVDWPDWLPKNLHPWVVQYEPYRPWNQYPPYWGPIWITYNTTSTPFPDAKYYT